MVHTELLLLGLSVILLLSQAGLQLLPLLPYPQDRGRLQLFILAAPPLILTLLSVDILVMAVRGCIHNWTAADAWITGGLIAAWAVAAALATVRGLWWRHRLQRDLAALPAEQVARVSAVGEHLAARLGLRRPPKLLVCRTDRPLAATFGWRRPQVLLSTWLLERLTDRELEAIIAHELVHVRRHDALLLAAGGWSRNCAGIFPAVRHAWLRLLVDQELAVDQEAAALTRRPAAMASALLKCWEGMESGQGNIPISGTAFAGGDPADIESRITHLLQSQPDGSACPPRLGAWLLAALMVGLIVLALSPLFLMPSGLLFSCRFMA